MFVLLLYLCIECPRPIARGELIELLFGAQVPPESSTAHSLRQLLYRTRQLGVPLRLAKDGICLDAPEVDNAIDAYLGSAFADRATRKTHSVVVLPRFSPAQSAAAEWIDSVRDRYHNLLRRQLAADLDFSRQGGDWRTLELLARQLLMLDPLSETATLYLAEALARNGSKSMAISLLEKYEHEVEQQGWHITLPSQVLRKRIAAVPLPRRGSSSKQLPFVGRVAAMQQVTELWNRARRGAFSLGLVSGEKSIGKTRLCEEFSASVRLDGTGAVVCTSVASSDRDRPLSLFVRLVADILTLRGAAGCDPDAIQLLRRLTVIAAPVGPVGSFSQPLYDEASIRLALVDLFASVCEEQALLCFVDNYHNLDNASFAVLQALQSRVGTSRVLFLLAGSSKGLPRDLSLTTIQLQALSVDVARSLLQELLPEGETQLTRPIDWLLEIASGNPGHLELLATAQLTSAHSSSLPIDLLALHDERLASLSQHAQHVLQALAVLSEEATGESMAALTGLSAYALLSAFQELEHSSLLRLDERGFACRSTIIAERALVAASPAVLILLHERAATYIAKRTDQLPTDAGRVWRIAHHWKHANQPQKARDFLRSCWQQAINVGQPMIACDSIRRELATTCAVEDRGALLDDLVGALRAAGETGLTREAIEERQALSARLHDTPVQRARLAFDHLCARVQDNLNKLPEIDSVLEALQSGRLDRARCLHACRILMISADTNLDEALATKTYTSASRLTASDLPSVLLQKDIALFYHTVFGDRDEALNVATRIEALYAKSERSWLRSTSRRNCSLARLLVGTGDADLDQIEQDYFECLDASMTRAALMSASHLTCVLIDAGDHSQAREWLTRAERLTSAIPLTALPGEFASSKIDIAILDGDPEIAREYLVAMRSNAEGYSRGRLRNDFVIYQLRIKQAFEAYAPTDEEIARLLAYHEIAKRRGRHDDHMSVLWTSLRARKRSAEAGALLASYLTEDRRERRECRYMLRVPTANDPAWNLPRASAVTTP